MIVFLTYLSGCEKYDADAFKVRITLVDELGKKVNSFAAGDSLIFKYYLINQTGKNATYSGPCQELMDFLRVYKEDSAGVYNYLGKPGVPCVAVERWYTIKNDETKLIGTFPLFNGFGWPYMNEGNYFVGEILTLRINNDKYDFKQRIYFEIK